MRFSWSFRHFFVKLSEQRTEIFQLLLFLKHRLKTKIITFEHFIISQALYNIHFTCKSVTYLKDFWVIYLVKIWHILGIFKNGQPLYSTSNFCNFFSECIDVSQPTFDQFQFQNQKNPHLYLFNSRPWIIII